MSGAQEVEAFLTEMGLEHSIQAVRGRLEAPRIHDPARPSRPPALVLCARHTLTQ